MIVLGAKGNSDLVKVDSHESGLYDNVWAAPFAPNNKDVTFIALDGKKFLSVRYAPESAPSLPAE